jgi:uncharacterized membrane protein YcaP (DUF421 family)
MDFTNIGSVTFRALISLLTLFIVTKILGKKQVSELSLFDYVIGISIGNFAAEMTINLDSPEVNGIWAVIIFGIVAYMVSWLTMKSITLRKIIMGTPTIIIKDGIILKDNMKKVHLDVNELLEECRIKGYFDISEVSCAIMEVNGEISILPKSNNKLLANVIIDGNIIYKNLEVMNRTKDWLYSQLKLKGYTNISNIILCTLDNNDKLNIYTSTNSKSNNILEM